MKTCPVTQVPTCYIRSGLCFPGQQSRSWPSALRIQPRQRLAEQGLALVWWERPEGPQPQPVSPGSSSGRRRLCDCPKPPPPGLWPQQSLVGEEGVPTLDEPFLENEGRGLPDTPDQASATLTVTWTRRPKTTHLSR